MNDQYVVVQNLTRSLKKPLHLKKCNTFLSRLRGFLFAKAPQVGDGLLFCFDRASRLNSAIHMIGVSFPLGVIWLDERKTVVDICRARPWGLAFIPKKPALYVMECSPERLTEFQIGDILQFIE
ncbi:MAG: DUF192 domain-containing protein [Anaerolineales bacterium]